MKRAWTIFRREIKELRKNRTFFQTMATMPLLLILFPMGVIIAFNVLLQNVYTSGDLTAVGGSECQAVSTSIGAVGGCTQTDLLTSMLAVCFSFFLPVPAVLPMMIAANSVVIEKERKSLEPLLVTPVTTFDLLLGKGLSALIPSVLIIWSSFALLLVLVVGVLKQQALDELQLPLWVGLILLWTPLMSGISTLVGVAISSRARDARAAQQLGGLIVLPEVLLVLGIGLKVIVVTPLLLVAGIIVGVAVNVGLFWLAIRIFERENILTRWR